MIIYVVFVLLLYCLIMDCLMTDKVEHMTHIDVKQRHFYHGYPHFGEYKETLTRVKQVVKELFNTIYKNSNIVIFDLDDTLIYTREFNIPITEIIELVHIANSIPVIKVILVTARPETSRQDVLKWCKQNGLIFDEIHFTTRKQELRDRLENDNPIAITIGDQWNDIHTSGIGIKLPDSYDTNAYRVENNKASVI